MRHERLLQIHFVERPHRRKSRRDRARPGSTCWTIHCATGCGNEVGKALLTGRLRDVFTQRGGMAAGWGTPDTGRHAFLSLDLSRANFETMNRQLGTICVDAKSRVPVKHAPFGVQASTEVMRRGSSPEPGTSNRACGAIQTGRRPEWRFHSSRRGQVTRGAASCGGSRHWLSGGNIIEVHMTLGS